MPLWGPRRSLLFAPAVSNLALWTPSDLGTANRLWVKADTGTHLTGSDVDQLDDQSGRGFSLFGGSSAEPNYNATGYNGGPSIDFSTGDYMATEVLPVGGSTSVGLNLGTTSSWFFAGNIGATTDSYGRIFSYIGNTDVAGASADFAATNSCAVLHRNATNDEVATTQASAALSIGSVTMGANVFILVTFNGTAQTLYINDLETPITTPVSNSANLDTSGVLCIGGFLQSATGSMPAPSLSFLVAKMAEVLVSNTAFDLATRQNLKAYALARIGL